MRPILFELGAVKVYSFGSLIAIGVLVAGWFAYWAHKSRQQTRRYIFDTILYTFLAGLLAARLLYFLIYHDQFQSFWQLFYVWQGGMIAFGGLIVGFLTYLYWLYQHRQNRWLILDIGALTFLLAWAIGENGCFLSSCAVGKAAISHLAINGTYPVDLLSSLWALLIFVVLLVVWLRQWLEEGMIFLLAAESFFLGQLVILTLRADYGDRLIQLEAVCYLVLMGVTYLVFWRLHGPGAEWFGLLYKKARKQIRKKWRRILRSEDKITQGRS